MAHPSRRQFLKDATCSAALIALTGLKAVAAPVRPALLAPHAKSAKPNPSRKKGICGGIHGDKGLLALRASWFYTWSSTAKQVPPAGVQWIPQIFPHKNENIQASCLRLKKEGVKILLGYNEPDHPGQGNITVEQAVAGWPFLESTGAKLISPAVTWAPNKWMKDFMAAARAKNFRIDAVGIHWYGAPDPHAFLKYVETAHKDYGKPIWVTEFAVQARKGSPSQITAEQVLKFQQTVLPEFENLDWLERYCWYNPHKLANGRTACSCVLDDHGSLTDLGHYFASL